MENILRLKHHSRAFFIAIFFILGFIFLVRFFIIPIFEPTLKLSFINLSSILLDNLFASFIVTIFIGVFVFWLTPQIMEKSIMKVIEPKEINPLLSSAAKTSRLWIFKGAAGRYTRAVTLPTMAEAARHEGLGRDIKLFLINPRNENICSEYAIYRKSLESGKDYDWNLEKVRDEVLATIVYTLILKYEHPLLRLEIYLLDNFSTFRYDISDKYVVITKEDKQVSALKADEGTYYYNSYIDELRLNERQGIKVNSISTESLNTTNISKENLKYFIQLLNILDDSQIEKINLEKIITSIKEPKNPYKN